jgi:hypothetical protein
MKLALISYILHGMDKSEQHEGNILKSYQDNFSQT